MQEVSGSIPLGSTILPRPAAEIRYDKPPHSLKIVRFGNPPAGLGSGAAVMICGAAYKIARPGMKAIVLVLLALTASAAASPLADRFVAAAVALENPRIVYDASYRHLAYPGGDVPANLGVCSDVVVRAYRAIGIDLQALVHDDMARHFTAYPQKWHRNGPDPNIDHRRMPNLATFFRRHGRTLPITTNPADYRPGDIVTWNLVAKGDIPHIGIVTDRRSRDGTRPLLMHNIGGGQVLEDVLFGWRITGHFRYGLD